MDSESHVDFEIPKDLETSVLFVYSGSGTCMESNVSKWDVLLLEEGLDKNKNFYLASKEQGLKAILFSGIPIKEHVSWMGPFVQGSDSDLHRVIREYQSGRFPRVRVDHDYKS